MYLETDFTRAIRAKAQQQDLNQTQLAKSIGVVQSAMVLVLRGVSQPNSVTINNYTRFLGLPTRQVKAMVGRQTPKTRVAEGKIAVQAPGPAPAPKGGARDMKMGDVLALAEDELAWGVHRAPKATGNLLK